MFVLAIVKTPEINMNLNSKRFLKSEVEIINIKIDIINVNMNFELEINSDGAIQHNNYINHCLTFAFGICTQPHTTIC